MKLLLSILSFLFVLNSGCKKENISGQSFGNASASLNGTVWKITNVRTVANQACYNGKLGIEISKYNSQGLLREVLNFSKVQITSGLQKVYNANLQDRCNDSLDATYITLTDDGDVLLDEYIATIGSSNNIEIDKYDATTNIINGRFTVSFIITRRQSANAPDTLHFTNGKFYTKIF